MARQLDVDDLLERMSIKVLNGTCEFILVNNTPPDWRVRITEGGCKFFYSDGESDVDGPRNIMLDSGQSYAFHSGDRTKCVKQCFLAITLSAPGEGEQTKTYTSEMAPKDECWIRNGVELGPKLVMAEAELAKPGISVRLELSKNVTGLISTNRSI
ncbi:hypothetical protein KXS07_23630 [Inquilinus limosus]|uniref:hypothetical protein n=1 Tax=Inquilinus limosus TaxID=171674 RepID=UPI003F18B449